MISFGNDFTVNIRCLVSAPITYRTFANGGTAGKALKLHLNKLHQSSCVFARCANDDMPSMLSVQQHLRVFQHPFKDTQQWWGKLMLQVVLCVNGNVVV